MVGDALREDIEGARNAGMRAIWMNRKNMNAGCGAPPDYTVRDIADIPRVVEGIR